MKRDLTVNEMLGIVNAKEVYNNYVGGLFCALEDYPKDSDDYELVVSTLEDPEGVKDLIKEELKRDIAIGIIKGHFATDEWVEKIVNRLFAKDEEYHEWLDARSEA